MPQGDKSTYTDKQKRKAEHIEEGYEDRGVSEKEAERRAWATVNRESGGGKKSGINLLLECPQRFTGVQRLQRDTAGRRRFRCRCGYCASDSRSARGPPRPGPGMRCSPASGDPG